MALQYMASPVPDRELKKGSAELMILSLLEDRARHGYEIGQLIELRSRGAIRFNVASLYPLLYRLEKRNWIRGRWIEKPGQRRRRYYRLTASGKNVLSKQRAGWREFVEAINLITGRRRSLKNCHSISRKNTSERSGPARRKMKRVNACSSRLPLLICCTANSNMSSVACRKNLSRPAHN
jgi:PadR family transcriptional regulator, regulatory protein PadR